MVRSNRGVRYGSGLGEYLEPGDQREINPGKVLE